MRITLSYSLKMTDFKTIFSVLFLRPPNSSTHNHWPKAKRRKRRTRKTLPRMDMHTTTLVSSLFLLLNCNRCPPMATVRDHLGFRQTLRRQLRSLDSQEYPLQLTHHHLKEEHPCRAIGRKSLSDSERRGRQLRSHKGRSHRRDVEGLVRGFVHVQMFRVGVARYA